MAQQPINHHWFPRCLMEPWVGQDGKVESFYRHDHKVASSRKSTKRIGSTDNLHSLFGFDEGSKLLIERNFSLIEGRYSIVRDLIKGGRSNEVASSDRFAFALMLCSLPLRRIDRFSEGSESIANDWVVDINNRIPDSEVWNSKTDEERAILCRTFGRATYFEASFQFAKEFAHSLCSYRWDFIDFSSQKIKLVLADRPFRRDVRLPKNIIYSMPVTPNHLFVASSMGLGGILEYEDAYRELLLVKSIGHQFRQASRFVIGVQRDPYMKMAEAHMKEVNQPAPLGTL